MMPAFVPGKPALRVNKASSFAHIPSRCNADARAPVALTEAYSPKNHSAETNIGTCAARAKKLRRDRFCDTARLVQISYQKRFELAFPI